MRSRRQGRVVVVVPGRVVVVVSGRVVVVVSLPLVVDVVGAVVVDERDTVVELPAVVAVVEAELRGRVVVVARYV